MKKNERDFLINVMWVPFFASFMTVALSQAPSVNPYIVAIFIGIAGAAVCYLDYLLFIKKHRNNNGSK